MADENVFMQETHQSNSLPFSLDPVSFILSQNPTTHQLKVTTESFFTLERGPRYKEYVQLRDSRLRLKKNVKNLPEEGEEEEVKLVLQEESKKTPVKKQVRFGHSLVNSNDVDNPLEEVGDRFFAGKKQVGFGGNMVNQRKASSSLAQSVPDFSAMVRKENRKPANTNALPRAVELTPPPKKASWARNSGVLMSSGSRGSKSASAGEKKKAIGMARKSYASVEDLRKVSVTAARDINGENKGQKAGGNKTALGYRQFY